MTDRADRASRQVGESYRDYAARMTGDARAAEMDLDTFRAVCDELGIHHDTTAAEVVRAIRVLRSSPAWPVSPATDPEAAGR